MSGCYRTSGPPNSLINSAETGLKWQARNNMLKAGILNPKLLSLLARVRHTNTLVISDRGFPFWPQIETLDISLCDGIPTVLQVLEAIRGNFVIGKAFMAAEFLASNSNETRLKYEQSLDGAPLHFESHENAF